MKHQVPREDLIKNISQEIKSVLVLGRGRVARHLFAYFDRHQIPYTEWNRDRSTLELNHLASSSSVTLLALPDRVIQNELTNLFDSRILQDLKNSKKLIHFSGASYHESIVGVHPLNTFCHEDGPNNKETMADRFQESILFIDDIAQIKLIENLFPQNKVVPIRADQKKLYHALCSLSANGLQILWKSCLDMAEEMEIPKKAFEPLLKNSALNFWKHSDPLTGPLQRGDQETIQLHKQALEKTSLMSLYEEIEKLFYKQNRTRDIE